MLAGCYISSHDYLKLHNWCCFLLSAVSIHDLSLIEITREGRWVPYAKTSPHVTSQLDVVQSLWSVCGGKQQAGGGREEILQATCCRAWSCHGYFTPQHCAIRCQWRLFNMWKTTYVMTLPSTSRISIFPRFRDDAHKCTACDGWRGRFLPHSRFYSFP